MGEFWSILALLLLFAIIGAIIGSIKKMGLLGFLYGFLLGPIGLLIICIWVAKSKEGKKKCPDCANWVNEEAKICSHCKYKFEEKKD